MYLSYSSYTDDIISFDTEEYIKNLIDSNSCDFFFNFIENYKEIETEDFKKPVFSQTTKFKKIPSNYKNYKYLKINRDNDEIKNKWVFEGPENEYDKISILIKTYLNKISQDTYKKISTDFLNEIVALDCNINLFEILSIEILNKCIFDNKYRNLYVNLCYKIWTNKQIHYNNVNIFLEDDKYYCNIKSNDEIHGPFTSEINAKNDIYNKFNFKKYFINHIQKLFNNKDFSFENLNEEDIFIKKKKILLLTELISIIFIEKYINFDIINIIIIDLLHINNNIKPIEEIELESLYVLLKLIKENKNTYNDLSEYKIIFTEFNDIIIKIRESNNLSKRSIFFIGEIITIINLFTNNKDKDKDNSYKSLFVDKINNKDIILEKIKKNEFSEIINLYKNIKNEDKNEIIKKLIEIYVDQTKINEQIILLLKELKEYDIIYNNIDKIIDNINDIILDVPNIESKLNYIINNIDINNNKKIYFLDKIKLNLILNSDDSESDESDDTESDESDDMENDTQDDTQDDAQDDAQDGAQDDVQEDADSETDTSND
jgi:hypothetical protein